MERTDIKTDYDSQGKSILIRSFDKTQGGSTVTNHNKCLLSLFITIHYGISFICCILFEMLHILTDNIRLKFLIIDSSAHCTQCFKA